MAPSSKKLNQKTPLWSGPAVDGITFSLLSRFLVCRERFRLQVVEGLKEDEGFNPSIEYGSMFHEGEEAHRKGKPWDLAMKKYRTKLLAQYPSQEAEIHKWSAICLKQYPEYLKYWEQHEDETCREPILAEASFKIPYTLPSGRTIFLRGKFDAVTILPIPQPAPPQDKGKLKLNKRHNPKTAPLGIFLQENKTKGRIDEDGILHTVSQNLQTMLYQIALRQCYHNPPANVAGAVTNLNFPGGKMHVLPRGIQVAGTLYNVIRRPLADQFAIKQRIGKLNKKTGHREGAESNAQFIERVAQGIREKPEYYFPRWKVLLTDDDVQKFKERIFHPILEQLCDWWEWISVDPFDPWRPRTAGELEAHSMQTAMRYAYPNVPSKDDKVLNSVHFQTPWGVYNSMFGGFRGDYFEYLTQGREYQLTKITTLFPEL